MPRLQRKRLHECFHTRPPPYYIHCQESWQGTLPPLFAHNRQFPNEEGAYERLKEPITVNGTICRADWVDGASIRCRDTFEGGNKRLEDWAPSSCKMCAMFNASPCSEIFYRCVLRFFLFKVVSASGVMGARGESEFRTVCRVRLKYIFLWALAMSRKTAVFQFYTSIAVYFEVFVYVF